MLYLFYIGIYQLNIRLLRTNLIALFMIDEIRRILIELIIPTCTQNKEEISKAVQRKITKSKIEEIDEDETSDIASKIINDELEELEKEEVELFDDYLEMVMTYGYITMFASAFPFGATITCLFLWLETRSDIIKIETIARRPFSRKTHEIGPWERALEFLTFISIFTNIILSCYASEQLDHLIPYLSHFKSNSATEIFTIFGIEHLMLAIVIIFKRFYDKDPRWLGTLKDRKQFRDQQSKMKLQKLTK